MANGVLVLLVAFAAATVAAAASNESRIWKTDIVAEDDGVQ
jgi:hypothetical protein